MNFQYLGNSMICTIVAGSHCQLRTSTYVCTCFRWFKAPRHLIHQLGIDTLSIPEDIHPKESQDSESSAIKFHSTFSNFKCHPWQMNVVVGVLTL